MSEKFGSTRLLWKKVASEDEIPSLEQSILLFFKHSTRCPISHTVLKRFTKNWESYPSSPPTVEPYLIDVLKERPISNLIAKRYNTEHASPQVLLIVNGTCTYHASHEQIKYEDLQKALS